MIVGVDVVASVGADFRLENRVELAFLVECVPFADPVERSPVFQFQCEFFPLLERGDNIIIPLFILSWQKYSVTNLFIDSVAAGKKNRI